MKKKFAKSLGAKQTERIEFRVSPDMKNKIESMANRHGGVANFMRLAVDNFYNKDLNLSASKTSSSGIAAHNTSWHLSRIGNSLNQMAYVINKANNSGRVNDKLVKEFTKELMYLNIKIKSLTEKM